MKNVTLALDDETHRHARIRAAELGTSLSAMVKDYLEGLESGAGVRDMPMQFHAPPLAAPLPAQKGPEGQPYFVNGKWTFTKDGNPRKPGSLKGKLWIADDFDEWPADILQSFEAWPYDDPAFEPLPFDEKQLDG